MDGQKTSKSKGFTLVELVIVIAIIGILAAVLIPTFASSIDNANQTAAVVEGEKLRAGIIAEYTSVDEFCAQHKDAVGKIEDTGKLTLDKNKIQIDDLVINLKEVEKNYEIKDEGQGKYVFRYITESGYLVEIKAVGEVTAKPGTIE